MVVISTSHILRKWLTSTAPPLYQLMPAVVKHFIICNGDKECSSTDRENFSSHEQVIKTPPKEKSQGFFGLGFGVGFFWGVGGGNFCFLKVSTRITSSND